MHDIQKANALLAIQASFASFDLQHYIPQQKGNKASVKAFLNEDTGFVEIEVKYPVAAFSAEFNATLSLLGVYKNFDKINDVLLPFYFGNRMQFIKYDLSDDWLVGKYSSDYKSASEDYMSCNLSGEEIRPIDISEIVSFQAHEAARGLDFIMGKSNIPRLVRIPSGQLAIDRNRLMESIYSLDFFKMGEREMIRMILISPRFLKGNNRVRLDACSDAILQYGSTEKNVLDCWVSRYREWNRKLVMEVKLVL